MSAAVPPSRPDGPAWPRFSILISNYNYARFVAEAARSALAQDYPADRFQVIVVDDGSTDDSLEQCAPLRSDPRFVLLSQPNRGQSAAFEAGVAAANGDYICLLDSDDLYLPNKLRRLAEHIRSLPPAPDSLFLCHDLVVQDVRGREARDTEASWFEVLGIGVDQQLRTLDSEVHHFPFSVPAGLVLARPLIMACLQALPTFAYQRGTDGILCPMALLRAGRVHYLHERLAIYRVHGANEFAQIVEGRYVPRFDPSTRTPRSLHVLERWIDTLALQGEERARALDWFMRFEHLGRRLSLGRGVVDPAVAVVEAHDVPHRHAAGPGLRARCAQSHERVEFLVQEAPGQPEFAWLAEAWRRSPADYLVFLRPGDAIDRTFVERHLLWRQHAALVGVSCCDVRLLDARGALVHDSVFRNAGAWKQPLQQVPPLATGLRDWVAAPMPACMFRRTALLDALLQQAGALPAVLQHAGFWFLFQFQLLTAGALRIRETLASCSLPDGAAASYGYLSAPPGADGALLQPPVAQAVEWLADFHAQEAALFQRWLPPAWHARFAQWLAAQRG